MSDFISLTNRYTGKGILVDTNLLLLLFIGSFDIALIENFKRTKQYKKEDYQTLSDYLNNFKTIITTPNILTEVSNLACNLGNRSESFFSTVFTKAIDILDERYIPSKTVSCSVNFQKFGLTDAGIMSLVIGQYLLLTDDFRLSQVYTSKGGDVINFNHIRPFRW